MIVAVFDCEQSLRTTLETLARARVTPVETYTPAPLPNESEASPVPLIILAAALIGGFASFALQTWSSSVAYPFKSGGRPDFAWPSFIPTVFENAVLVALAAGFTAFLIVTRLPHWYDPIDEARGIRSASSDGWVLAVRTETPEMIDRAASVLRESGAIHVEQLPS